MRLSLLVPAGGSGERFRSGFDAGQKIPSKLLMPLSGRPVLIRTLEAFQCRPEICETILAVSKSDEAAIKNLLKQYKLKNIRLVYGGATRSESVLNALRKAHPDSDWVLVHDAARPFFDSNLLPQMLSQAETADGLILAKRVIPTIKEMGASQKVLRTIDRSRLAEAETPQLVRRSVLESAYEQPNWKYFTDEASLLESISANVQLFLHDGWNPKITTKQDYILAEAYIKQGKESPMKTGLGYDIHRLVPNRKLYLGGVLIPFEKGPLGHSDGDVLLHAVIDAILGAIGAGDIGEWFSDKNPKYKGIRSAKMLEAVLDEARGQGWMVSQIDTIIHLEKPKLAAFKNQLRDNLAKLLRVSSSEVSIKAKTGEGLGPVGEGQAISADALVTMKRIN